MEVQTQRSQPNAMARLYDAALKGDVHSLNNLLQEDALILERCIIERSRYTQSPLHVAAKMGHLDFVKTVLEANSTMRFAHDEDGMTPVHVAAIHGKIDVLETFHSEKPQAIRELTKSGETVLHLCVKHNQMEALLLLLNHKDEIDLELLINSEDSDGNTILHLAVIGKQVEMVKLLLKQNRIEVSSVNKKGLTALDCHLLRRKVIKLCWCREVTKKWPNGDEIGPALENAKALRGKDTEKIKKREKQVKDQSNALMVAASVIAAMAFEFCVSPSDRSLHLLVSNTIALASSLSVIILLIGGLPYSRIFVRVLRITMWIAVSAIAVTYITSIRMLADYRWSTLLVTLMYTSLVWSSVMAILILTHTHNFLVNFVINHPTLRSFFSNNLCCACVNDEKAIEQV